MSRAVRTSALLAALALLALATAGGAVAGSHQVQAARSCHLSSHAQRHLGATYVTSLSVKKVSCAKGKGVVKAYQSCRRSRGYMGRCGSAAGYSCSRRILDKNSVTYDAKVTCKKGGKRVVHTYQQNK
jgi:hypothetical protein